MLLVYVSVFMTLSYNDSVCLLFSLVLLLFVATRSWFGAVGPSPDDGLRHPWYLGVALFRAAAPRPGARRHGGAGMWSCEQLGGARVGDGLHVRVAVPMTPRCSLVGP